MKNPAQFNVSHLNNVSSENTLCHIFLPYVKKLSFKKNFSSKISLTTWGRSCFNIYVVFCDHGRTVFNFICFIVPGSQLFIFALQSYATFVAVSTLVAFVYVCTALQMTATLVAVSTRVAVKVCFQICVSQDVFFLFFGLFKFDECDAGRSI